MLKFYYIIAISDLNPVSESPAPQIEIITQAPVHIIGETGGGSNYRESRPGALTSSGLTDSGVSLINLANLKKGKGKGKARQEHL